METTTLLEKLVCRQDLTRQETEQLFAAIADNNIGAIQAGAILTALHMKGETSEEILGFIQTMRRRMVPINAPNAIDVCGTGGDKSGSFNISTAVAFVVAGAGVPVVKHGNRAASSRCGSADVLEALGVRIQLSASEAEEVFQEIGLVFLFAPLFHPALKQLVAVRRELAIRTVFNYLGPFANPASVTRQLIGVPDLGIATRLADVSRRLGYRRLIIIANDEGLDELSLNTVNTVFEVRQDTVQRITIDPKTYGYAAVDSKLLGGGEAHQNAQIIRQILRGTPGPQHDIVVFNAALALILADQAPEMTKAIEQAEAAIVSGAAMQALEKLIKETNRYA